MEKLLATGKVKAIGVSNFDIHNLEVLTKSSKVIPSVNQVELHPYLQQDALLEYCKKRGIVLTAYSP
jgi:glycerol 2-dehydrogenase (NADP+)